MNTIFNIGFNIRECGICHSSPRYCKHGRMIYRYLVYIFNATQLQDDFYEKHLHLGKVNHENEV